jgi:hypothetical protein
VHRGLRHSLDGRSSQGSGWRTQCKIVPKTLVVGCFFVGAEQAIPGLGKMIEDPLGVRRILSGLESLDVGHLPVCRRLNDPRVRLKPLHAQQPVMVRRLMLGGNSQPDVIGIEVCQASPLQATVHELPAGI